MQNVTGECFVAGNDSRVWERKCAGLQALMGERFVVCYESRGRRRRGTVWRALINGLALCCPLREPGLATEGRDAVLVTIF